MRFAGANFGGVDDAKSGDAIGFTAFLEGEEFGFFVGVGGNDKFAGVPVRDVVTSAEFVSEAVTFDAQAGFERAFGVIDSRVDDAAIARAGGHADVRILFGEEDVLVAFGDGVRDGAADYAAADD